MNKVFLLAVSSILASGTGPATAQVPTLLHYQGRATVAGTSFSGIAQFKFALVGGAIPTTFWSNNGTSANGSEPSAAVPIPVQQGLYAVALGDTSLANMTPIPPGVFTNQDVRLRIWFNDGTHGTHLLTPDQRVTAAGYAMMAANLVNGTVTSEKLAAGAVTGDKIASGALSGSKIANNSIDSARLSDQIALGSSSADGRLDVFRTANGLPALSLIGNSSQISTFGSDGLEQIRLWGPAWGELLLRDNTPENSASAQVVAHETRFVGFPVPGLVQSPGGALRLAYGAANRVYLKANPAGGLLQLARADGTTTVSLDADAEGQGRVITEALEITASADVSAQFDVQTQNADLKPGFLVCLDPDNPGRLVPSAKAYDKTVAGVVSGANGVRPGMLLASPGAVSDGKQPVALTGRVYCWADADRGPIRPGDLITTSDTPGHGMKATDPNRVFGAVVGKAMSSLPAGRGLILLLVSLQ